MDEQEHAQHDRTGDMTQVMENLYAQLEKLERVARETEEQIGIRDEL